MSFRGINGKRPQAFRPDPTASQVALSFLNKKAGRVTISLGRDVRRMGHPKRGAGPWVKAIIHGPVLQSLGSAVPPSPDQIATVLPPSSQLRNQRMDLLPAHLEALSDRGRRVVCGVIPFQRSLFASPFENPLEILNREGTNTMGSSVAMVVIRHHHKDLHLMGVLVRKIWCADVVSITLAIES